MESPTPPTQDATPTEVRSWFTTLLCDLHGVPETEATEIAAKWRFGRGSELTYYDVDTFRNIFGGEAGTILFGHARKELRTDKRGSTDGVNPPRREKKDIFGLTPGLAPVYIFLVLSILLGMRSYSECSYCYGGAGRIMLCIFSLIAFLGSYYLFYFGS